MSELLAASTRLVDWSWLRIEKRHHARNYCWWAILPFGLVRVRWVYTRSLSWFEWLRENDPTRCTVKLGSRWSLYLTFDRGFRLLFLEEERLER